jgi:DNA-binding winged helix-turn-helix (wHTH) protein
MKYSIAEAAYPVKFRSNDVLTLAEHLHHRHSLEVIGMKRVGIHNFLRFFLFQKHIEKKYIAKEDGKNLFIFVDLNDLVEHDLFAFWRLTLKRIMDSVDIHVQDQHVKEKISALFLRCIQTHDFFLTYDGVKESLVFLAKEGFLPTIFFTRFDRLKDVASLEFFDNLKSIRDATGEILAYVFTSFRKMSKIFPTAIDNELVSRFVTTEYIRPLTLADQRVMLHVLLQQYQVPETKPLEETILTLSNGHVQYLRLCVIIAHEFFQEKHTINTYQLTREIEEDERITFLSEELWESITENEQNLLKKIVTNKKISQDEHEQFPYIWKSGLIVQKGKKQRIFNPLLERYVKDIESDGKNANMDLSKKEFALFQYLQDNLHEICEREKIAEVVWPEYKEYGVSDWAIDRLVARVRSKLKKQESPFELITIRTRGYKLVPSSE